MLEGSTPKLEIHHTANAVILDGSAVDPRVHDETCAGFQDIWLAGGAGRVKGIQKRRSRDLAGWVAMTRRCGPCAVGGQPGVVDKTHGGDGLRGVEPLGDAA